MFNKGVSKAGINFFVHRHGKFYVPKRAQLLYQLLHQFLANLTYLEFKISLFKLIILYKII